MGGCEISILGLLAGTGMETGTGTAVVLYIMGALIKADFCETNFVDSFSSGSGVASLISVSLSISLALRINSSSDNELKTLPLPSVCLLSVMVCGMTMGDVPGGEMAATDVVFGFILGRFNGMVLVEEDWSGGGTAKFGSRGGGIFVFGRVRFCKFMLSAWSRGVTGN